MFVNCKSDHKLRDFCVRQGKNGETLAPFEYFDAVLAQKIQFWAISQFTNTTYSRLT
ncbi:hypothetical protein AGMMS50284_1820 [Clostridia bacterium]|nr:hypothetical protein AGMMS50284_1820 [Clostridia bacterium]